MGERYVGRKRSYGSLTADIDEIIKNVDARMIALIKASIQDVVFNMQTPVGKGGRMRVDTGFLRNSGRAQIGSMPTGETDRPNDALPGSFTWDEGTLTSVLTKLKLGDTFYWGWTANYARYRELYDGFMEAALQHWSRIVAFNADTLIRNLKK